MSADFQNLWKCSLQIYSIFFINSSNIWAYTVPRNSCNDVLYSKQLCSAVEIFFICILLMGTLRSRSCGLFRSCVLLRRVLRWLRLRGCDTNGSMERDVPNYTLELLLRKNLWGMLFVPHYFHGDRHCVS